ncbi:MAG: hypothetical protein QM770_02300 [Tepidisphaeraceae bacterium]
MNASISNHFSSKVELCLRMDDGALVPVWQVGPDFIAVEGDICIPPGRGVLVVTVDGKSSEYEVALVDGIDPNRFHQPIVNLSLEQPS